MACGTPVVTSNVTSLPEMVGDAALTVVPYNVGALVRAIKQAVTDTALRAKLRHRGIARAAQFPWKRTAQAMRATHQQVLSQPHQLSTPYAPQRPYITRNPGAGS